jgi:ParB family transcriptional regulator, chromosome partitioning protein
MTGSKRPRLGRGLGALLGEDYLVDAEADSQQVRRLPLGKVVPNPFQPRRDFGATELSDLCRSISENGLLQPIVVRPSPSVDGDRYELVAGERRLRAVSELGWSEIPAVVRDVDDRTLLVLALVENIQREALNPVEEAEGFRLLAEEFALTQEEIATAVGKDRSTVANTLRLLKLPPSIRKLLEERALSMGHARALLSVDDPGRLVELGRRAAREGWSVREVEARSRAERERRADSQEPEVRRGVSEDPVVVALREALEISLGSRVKLRRNQKGGGTIEIPFHSAEDFGRVFETITGHDATEVAG